MPPTILCLGLSHQTAPVALRERLLCSLEDLAAPLPQNSTVLELVLLSTCNRIELYAVTEGAPDSSNDVLEALLAQVSGVPVQLFSDYAYRLVGEGAVVHLLKVAAGLDSRVLGEPQILGQVTKAHMTAVSHHTSGPILNAVFQAAIRAGKRTRTETTISSNPASVSSVAISMARKVLGGLSRYQILVVGAGEMAHLAVKALRHRGLTNIAVANRTLSRAEALVAPWNGRAYTLEQLPEAIEAADVVISAVQIARPIITPATIGHRKRPLVLVDIAVPRNISQEVRELSQVQLFDVDDLQVTLDGALAERQAEIPHVEVIIGEEQENLRAELRQQSIKPLIVDMRRKAEAIRQMEIDRTLRHLSDLDPQALSHIQHLSRSLVNKLLHEPTIRLQQAAREDTAEPYVATVRDLFGLEN